MRYVHSNTEAHEMKQLTIAFSLLHTTKDDICQYMNSSRSNAYLDYRPSSICSLGSFVREPA